MRFPRRESGEESAYAPDGYAYAPYPDPAADAAQTRPELSPEQAEARGSVIGSLLIGAVALVAGAAAGIALFAAVTTPPITQDLPGTAVFAAFGAALPFGWRATRLRNTSLTLPLLVWPIAIVLRAWFSIIIGIPALVFYLVRNLWWLHRIADEIRVGHRFYGIMTLAIYAKKCGIDEDELRRDAFALLRPYDDMSVEDINRFTKDDVVCALEMFNEDYVTFPRDDIAKLSGLTMPVNKRNWRKQPVHLQGARAIQEINDKANGTNWREGNGRPKGSGTAQARVYEWRQQHPEGRKADCHRETGLDPKTVRKWWDCPPPAVRFENGHITVRVSPSQELSDWLLDALHDGGQE